MIISIPKEIMPGENRVACVPDVVPKLIKAGFEVQIEKNAGLSAGFTDDQFKIAGAKIVDSVEMLFSSADILLKVKSPQKNPTFNKNK